MASNNKAKDLKSKIELDYPNKKVLLINKEATDDNNKLKELIDVDNTWKNYDVIIYTPSITIGISFDTPKVFDYIFAYGCENSLSSKEFCQMMHRVREPINKTIYLSMSLYKEYNEAEDKITYKDTEQILCSDYYLTHYDLHNNLIPCKLKNEKIITDDNIRYEKVLYYPYIDDPNYDLFIRNSHEIIEDKLNFSASFYGYTKFKEYKLAHYIYEEKSTEINNEMKEIRINRETDEKESSVQAILDAPDITKEEFISLIKQRAEYLDEKDVNTIHRFRFKDCYKLKETEIEYDIVEEYNTKDKMKCYYNLVNILETEEQTTEEKLEIMKNNIRMDKWLTSCYMEFSFRNTFTNHLFAINIIVYCKFDINKLDTTIILSELEANLIDAINYIDRNKKEIAYKFGLKIYNTTITNMEFKEHLKTVNSILFIQYGFKIKKTCKKENKYQIVDNNMWSKLPKEKLIEPIVLYQKESNISSKKKYDISLLDFMGNDSD